MKISVVIPSFNGKALLQKNLPFIIKACQRWTKGQERRHQWEVIVVDDASTDETALWLATSFPSVKTVVNSSVQRFGKSCNLGVRSATGEVVVLLNNDVKPSEDFLDPLLDRFEDQKTFAVGCTEVNIENGARAAGGMGVSAFRRGLVVHWRPSNHVSTVTWVSGGSAAFRKSLWIQFGGFDPLFRPAYEEDRDLSWQALKAGYRIYFEPKAVVSHQHETTNRQILGDRRMRLYSLKNQLLFVWKNISSLRLLFLHILWIPYHLCITTWRTQGLFLLAFLLALVQFPEALESRARLSVLWRIRDEEILGLA